MTSYQIKLLTHTFIALFLGLGCASPPPVEEDKNLPTRTTEATPRLPQISADLPPLSRPTALDPPPAPEDCGRSAARCAAYARELTRGILAPADHAGAARAHQLACEAGEISSCVALGEHHEQGRGLPEARSTAAALYQRACEQSHGPGCRALAAFHDRGKSGAVARDEALLLYTRACSLSDGPSCYALGLAYDRGLGVVPEVDRAADYFGQACTFGEPYSCRWLSRRAHEGRGVPRDEARAQLLAARAASAWEIGCDAGDAAACVAIAGARQTGLGVPTDELLADTDYGRAINLLRWACDAGDAFGCRDAADLLDGGGPYSRRDRKEAKALWRRAAEGLTARCDANDLDACFWLAPILYDGRGVDEDRPKSAILYQKACDGGHPEACREHSRATKKGGLFSRDDEPGSTPSTAPSP